LLGKLMREDAGTRVESSPQPKIVAHCARARGKHRVGLYAARHLESVLSELPLPPGIELGLGKPGPNPEALDRVLELRELRGVPLYARQSTAMLRAALKRFDLTLLSIGLGGLLLASLVTALVARRLARPIVALSKQAERVVHGDLTPVEATGGAELERLASSFNQALKDLDTVRAQLKGTERIAAQREIGRQVAHEIKNPLVPIRAAVETLRRLKARQDPAFEEYFAEASETVLDEVRRITLIIEEFTHFARLPAPNPSRVPLAEVVRSVVRLYDNEKHPVEVRIAEEKDVTVDRDQIIQVLTNLVQNAIEATADPGAHQVEKRVRVSLSVESSDVMLRVSDSGPGVPEDRRDKLFVPYATTKTSGTGLGLAIVKRIVEEHGGEVSYETSEFGGACFVVRLPQAGPPSARAGASAAPA
jgi:nitrogen fixation/metabolism regulation signal transduction histidine kinase